MIIPGLSFWNQIKDIFLFTCSHYLPILYLPPRALYVLTSQPLAYAEGKTLNFLFASDLTLEQSFLFVGTGFKRKGVNEFLKIIAAIESKEVVAFIVGKEKNLSYYKTLAQNLGIEKRVFFTGPRIDVNDFYSISDIFLFPTHYEPFGNVILEAMNANNIVFTTIQNGASEILSEDFLMQRPDDFSVVEKIDKLLKNPKQMKLIQENNREISSKFSIEANLERTLEIINEVID